MKAQPKSRRRIIDFIADAFDEFFGGQELHRARNALMPPPPPKEQPMNLDDYIFKCPTCINEGVLSPDGFLAIRSTQWRGPVLPPVMP